MDFIALDKGEIINSKAIDIMMTTIEEYIKWGLDFISEQMEDNPNAFFKDTAFLRVFLDMLPMNATAQKVGIDDEMEDDIPESLD